jgi:hypothetical protein
MTAPSSETDIVQIWTYLNQASCGFRMENPPKQESRHESGDDFSQNKRCVTIFHMAG